MSRRPRRNHSAEFKAKVGLGLQPFIVDSGGYGQCLVYLQRRCGQGHGHDHENNDHHEGHSASLAQATSQHTPYQTCHTNSDLIAILEGDPESALSE